MKFKSGDPLVCTFTPPSLPNARIFGLVCEFPELKRDAKSVGALKFVAT